MSETDDKQKVYELIEDARLAILTSVDQETGRLVSRPLHVQQVERDATVWFFASDESPKAEQLQANPQVNVAFTSGSTWVSLAGRGELVHDPAKIDELWNAGIEAWFPDGRNSPDVALLKVTAESAEYWDTPGSRITSAIAYAKSKLTGDRPDGVGANATVELT